MRTTLTLDDDVAALVERARKRRRASFRDVVNEALRLGLRELTAPTTAREPFRTKSVNLGRCLLGNVDDAAETLALAEGESFR